LYFKVKQYDRGSNNGAIDDNGDGKIDHYEAFAHWDFEQLIRVLKAGKPLQDYKWTNVDTCYVFHVNASDYFEDLNQGVLYQTCREFSYSVVSPSGYTLGVGTGQACRNFATHRWKIL
jgi:carotenoid cleavage dioxygenase-like enzyme